MKKEKKHIPWVAIGITLVFLFGALYYLHDVLTPFFLAFVLAYMLDPLIDFFEEKFHLHRFTVICFMVVLVVLISSVVLFSTIPEFIYQSQKVIDKSKIIIVEWENELNEETGWLSYIRPYLLKTVQEIKKIAPSIWKPLLQFMMNTGNWLKGSINFLINFFIFIIVMIYLLESFDEIIVSWNRWIPVKWRKNSKEYFTRVDYLLRHYIRGQFLVALSMGVLYGIGLTISGVRLGIFLGLLAGLLNFIPYLGLILGIIPPLLFTLIDYHSFPVDLWRYMGIIITFILVQMAEGFLLTPKIVGKKIGLSPVIIILSLMVFGKCLGFLGILFAIPIACVIKVSLGFWREKNEAIYEEEAELPTAPGRSDSWLSILKHRRKK